MYGLSMTPDETRLLACDVCNQRVVVADSRDGRSLRSLQGPAGTLLWPMQAIVVPGVLALLLRQGFAVSTPALLRLEAVAAGLAMVSAWAGDRLRARGGVVYLPAALLSWSFGGIAWSIGGAS